MENPSRRENPTVRLREATPNDIPALLALEKSVAGTRIYSPMREAAEWEEALQKGKVFRIERDGSVVGNLSYEKEGEERVYISGLVVAPHFQRQGIARDVLAQLLHEWKGVKRIDLVTHPDNQVALNLYHSLGFRIESRKENYYGDGEPRLVLALERR